MAVKEKQKKKTQTKNNQEDIYLKAFRLMCVAKRMAVLYDEEKEICAKYVHSTSRGHEAIQLATAFHLKPTTLQFWHIEEMAQNHIFYMKNV